jgi:hypothetical protein
MTVCACEYESAYFSATGAVGSLKKNGHDCYRLPQFTIRSSALIQNEAIRSSCNSLERLSLSAAAAT